MRCFITTRHTSARISPRAKRLTLISPDSLPSIPREECQQNVKTELIPTRVSQPTMTTVLSLIVSRAR
jgi:hypothetical protein